MLKFHYISNFFWEKINLKKDNVSILTINYLKAVHLQITIQHTKEKCLSMNGKCYILLK